MHYFFATNFFAGLLDLEECFDIQLDNQCKTGGLAPVPLQVDGIGLAPVPLKASIH